MQNKFGILVGVKVGESGNENESVSGNERRVRVGDGDESGGESGSRSLGKDSVLF